MRDNQHIFAAQHVRLHVVHVIGPDARTGIAQAFTAGRRNVIRPAPDMHLLFAPFDASVVLVEAGQVAIIALVQGLVADCFKAGLADLFEME